MSTEKRITVGMVVRLKSGGDPMVCVKAGTWHEDGDIPRRQITAIGDSPARELIAPEEAFEVVL